MTAVEHSGGGPDARSDEQPADGGTPAALSPAAAALERLQDQWVTLPGKYKLVLATSMSFVICNMDKVKPGSCRCSGGADGWQLVYVQATALYPACLYQCRSTSQLPSSPWLKSLGGPPLWQVGSLWSVAAPFGCNVRPFAGAPAGPMHAYRSAPAWRPSCSACRPGAELLFHRLPDLAGKEEYNCG